MLQWKNDFTVGKNEWTKIGKEFIPSNIFKAEETGFCYRSLPDHTYMIKTDKTKGCKSSRECITTWCCANKLGDKQKVLVIG